MSVGLTLIHSKFCSVRSIRFVRARRQGLSSRLLAFVNIDVLHVRMFRQSVVGQFCAIGLCITFMIYDSAMVFGPLGKASSSQMVRGGVVYNHIPGNRTSKIFVGMKIPIVYGSTFHWLKLGAGSAVCPHAVEYRGPRNCYLPNKYAKAVQHL